jgi:phage protein D
MMINDPAATSNFTKPRANVIFNKSKVVWSNLTVENCNYYNADTFKVTLPMYGNSPEWDVNKFTDEMLIDVEIDLSLDGGLTYTPIFYGRVDNIDFEYVSNSISVSGRDYSSLLIDTKTTERYPNNTSSEIVEQFALEHNLIPVVTETATPVGVFLNNEYVATGVQRTEWDILTFLAKQEDFLLFVRGKELHFQPKPVKGDDFYGITFIIDAVNKTIRVNAINPKFSRCLSIARDVSVEVVSFNSSTGNTVKRKATKSRSESDHENVQNYVYTKPNLTPEQALQLAQSYLQQITEREIVFHTDLFLDSTLDIIYPIQISGTGTKLDQIYFISKIERYLEFTGECSMNIEAKNHSTESEVNIV